MDVILIETKCFDGNVEINAQGEFTADYGPGKRFGIASPLAQSQRHERVVAKLLENLEITGRLGTKPAFHHLVMLHPKAIIRRPDPKLFDTRNVIKADQFAQWRERFSDETGKGLAAITGMLNLRASDTVREWAEKLARQHRPDDLLALPEFMRPRAIQAPPAVPAPRRPAATPVASVAPVALLEPEAQPANVAAAMPTEASTKRLICAACGVKISFPEGKFCWGNAKRFGGQQYCREHQASFS